MYVKVWSISAQRTHDSNREQISSAGTKKGMQAWTKKETKKGMCQKWKEREHKILCLNM